LGRVNFTERNAWWCLLEEAVVVIQCECPGQVAANSRQVKNDGHSAQYCEQDNVVNHDAAALKALGMAHCARNPIGGILVELSVEVAKIFGWTVGAGGPLALQSSDDQREDGTDQQGRPNPELTDTMLTIQPDGHAAEQKHVAERIAETFQICSER